MELNKRQREKLNNWINNKLDTTLFEDDFDELEKIITAYESFPVELPVRVQIAEIIDKEIEIQKKIEKHIEQVETGERLRQMRLISQSKRIAFEEIKKELLSNLSA